MLSTNYSTPQWKNLFLTLSLMIGIVGLPILAYLQFIFIPLLDGWAMALEILYGSLDSETIKPYVETLSGDEIFVLIIALLITAFGLLVVVFIPICLMFSYLSSASIWLAQRLHIYLMMNLVIFRNGRKIEELRLSQA